MDRQEQLRLQILTVALREVGVTEIGGNQHEQRILQYFKEIGHEWVKTDETAWCAAFINWTVKECGIQGTGKLNARSFLHWGKPVAQGDQKPGDIVIYWRESPDSWKGHVGIWVSERKGWIHTLGGNQSNSVRISPYDKGRYLACRRPAA